MNTDIVIYHNPECGTSRNALAMIRNAGIEPHVIEYLKTPPSRPLLESLGARFSNCACRADWPIGRGAKGSAGFGAVGCGGSL